MSIQLKKQRSNLQRGFILLLLFLAMVPASVTVHSSGYRLQPALAELAATKADTIIPVIVQLQPHTPSIAAQLTQFGGRQTKDLSMINAIVAELPAGRVPALAMLPAIRWISLDASVVETNCDDCIESDGLQTVYNQTIRADEVWNGSPHLRGKGIGVAIVDSGIHASHPDVAGRIMAGTSTVLGPTGRDGYGHGTFVAGIVGGNNGNSERNYIGVAPESNLVDVKVTTVSGASTESDVVEGLQWIYENHKAYNIRVVNISLNSSHAQSYHKSPLTAACEVLWFNGIVVVTSAGNHGEDAIYPPANDPFVITVGAVDDMGTETISDDIIAHFSAYGPTSDGFVKPDLVAPGRHIVAPMARRSSLLPLLRPNMIEDGSHMRMSGTSFSAPIVSGAIALLLEAEPELTPDQIKYRLMATANREWPGYDAQRAGAGYLDVAAAIDSDTHENANTNLPVSQLLITGSDLIGSLLRLNWDSVSWSTVSWSTVSWSTVSWSTVAWSSDYIEEDDTSEEAETTEFSHWLLRSAEEEQWLEEEEIKEVAELEPTGKTENEAKNFQFLPFVSNSD